MNPDNLQEMITNDLHEMNARIDELYGKIDREFHALIQDIPIKNKVEDTQTAINSLVKAKPEERSTTAMHAIASLGALNSQLDYLTARLNLPDVARKVGQKATNHWNNLQSYLQKLIHSIAGHLWQLISSLMTPKEWSLSGDTGVNLFGLSGTAGIQITFG
jgi:restriction endonuclease